MGKNEEYIEIDLGRLFKVLIRKLWIIILAALFCGAIGFSYARYLIVPTYQASALMYVNNNSIALGKTLSLSSSDLYASQELVDTYIVIMKSRTTLNDVIQQADLPYSYEQLSSMIAATTKDKTAVFSINVTSTDPEEATKIANTVASVLPQKIEEILDGSSARVVDYAVMPRSKATPNITLYAMLGLFAGALVSAGLIVLFELMNDSVRNAKMLPDSDTIPVLAEIPNMSGNKESEGFKSSHGKKKDVRRRRKS